MLDIPETLNNKHEILNKFKIQIASMFKTLAHVKFERFRILEFRNLTLFRFSNLEIRFSVVWKSITYIK